MNERGQLRVKDLSLLIKTPESNCVQAAVGEGLSTYVNKSNDFVMNNTGSNKPSKVVQGKKSPISAGKRKKGVEKKLPPNQPKIDLFFKSCSKTSFIKSLTVTTKSKFNSKVTANGKEANHTQDARKRRKRLFNNLINKESPQIAKGLKEDNCNDNDCIDLCSDSDETVDICVKEEEQMQETFIPSLDENERLQNTCTVECSLGSSILRKIKKSPCKTIFHKKTQNDKKTNQKKSGELLNSTTVSMEVENLQPKLPQLHAKKTNKIRSHSSKHAKNKQATVQQAQIIPNNSAFQKSVTFEGSKSNTTVVPSPIQSVTASSTKEVTNTTCPKRKRPCPPYKLVSGTSFAVDAFNFSELKGVTHYFLTHFHADHYLGLSRTFAMPIIMSPITAQLVRGFIQVKDCFLHVIELNQPEKIQGVEVTAIDANHCPGAVMFVFKLSTGKCILHTGDFRASPDMESEPIFWNNNIDLMYLDTTYISKKFNFCTQDESIYRAQQLIMDFRKKNEGKRILFICGSYLIGKEKFWSTIARINGFVVWTEERRSIALRAMQDMEILKMLCDAPSLADMHVINMGKITYFSLVEYFEPYRLLYDLCLALRPSGWETYSKPQYRGKINIIGIEYSEHSSHNELRRFVTYLRPKEVISTVPMSHNSPITSEIPESWYKYKTFPTIHRNYQTAITSYLNRKINKAVNKLKPNDDKMKENYCLYRLMQGDASYEANTSMQVSPNKHVSFDEEDDWIS